MPIERRSFVTAAYAQEPKRPVYMHVGSQRRGDLGREHLQYFKRHGVEHIAGWPADAKEATLADDLARASEQCAKEGVNLDVAIIPLLAGAPAAAIMLGKSPEREREMEGLHKIVEACASAGIPAVKYNLRVLFNVRSGMTPGRGGSSYSTWKFDEVKNDPPEAEVGKVDAEMFWERITWFLERFIPVCNENKIRAMCHPHDPGVPNSGYKGVDRVLGTVDGLKRLVSIEESPYHGLNLCLGTTAEMLQDPANELPDVIRYFGERKKLFNIHFRNIVGKRDDFYEVYPDNGDLNMPLLAETLYEVDYPYMLMPDHMPPHPDDPGYQQAFAYGFGYIKAVVQALERRNA